MNLNAFSQAPEQIYSITKIQKDYDYYSQQAALWEQETKKTSKNANAWFNYFTAARMNNMFAGENGSRYDLNTIAEELKTNLPNTFEYHYVSYKLEHDMDKSFAHIKRAYATDPERCDSWDAFINTAEFERDKKTMKHFFEKWYNHKTFSPGITMWNYNVLVGLDSDAVIITFGDNDTYPLWFLQTVKDMRNDVQVLNASLLVKDDYRETMFKEMGIPSFTKTMEELGSYQSFRNALMEHVIQNTKRPVYIGVSAPREFKDKHHNNLYIIGLAFKYSENDFDHVAVLRNNFESKFLKDYLKFEITNDFSQSVVNYMNRQYLPCLTVLYKHYMLSEEIKKANEVKELMIDIGDKNGDTKQIQDFLAKFK